MFGAQASGLLIVSQRRQRAGRTGGDHQFAHDDTNAGADRGAVWPMQRIPEHQAEPDVKCHVADVSQRIATAFLVVRDFENTRSASASCAQTSSFADASRWFNLCTARTADSGAYRTYSAANADVPEFHAVSTSCPLVGR